MSLGLMAASRRRVIVSAPPAFGANGARLAGASSSSANLSVPTTPAADANTLDVITLLTDGASVTLTPPDGTWTQAPDSPVTRASGAPHREHVWYKRATTDSGTYNFTTSDATKWREGICTRLTGVVASGDPFDDTASGEGFSTGNATTAVSVTTTGADRLLLFSSVALFGQTYTPPTGFTERYDATGGGGSFDTGLEIATKEQLVAGSSGSVSATLDSNGHHCAWIGAVRPASYTPTAGLYPATDLYPSTTLYPAS